MVNQAVYPDTVWTISMWRLNLRTYCCDRHCSVVFSYMFSVVVCFACIPCEQSPNRAVKLHLHRRSANSLQLARSGHIPMLYTSIYTYIYIYLFKFYFMWLG
jgi:hypothetical protein